MPKKILVVGDGIKDWYYFGKAVRLCLESPVPIVEWQGRDVRPGGACLVAGQMKEMLGNESVIEAYGSWSNKYRYYADGVMQLRADQDSIGKPPDFFDKHVEMVISQKDVDCVVVPDYGKGAMTKVLAAKIIAAGKPVFVDAKYNWEWYKGAFCAFPNRFEGHDTGELLESRDLFQHVVRKNGKSGCVVDGVEVRAFPVGELRDATGAGDNFLAAFVAAHSKTGNLMAAAKFANMVAAISVRHIGTHIVRRGELPEPKPGVPSLPTKTGNKADEHKSSDAMASGGGEGAIN